MNLFAIIEILIQRPIVVLKKKTEISVYHTSTVKIFQFILLTNVRVNEII